ncbi:hypothetical protein PR003_g32048, partial [Phytophthora rubi]
MDFMVPAGIRLDLADGSVCLLDEVKIQLSGRRQLYNDKARTLRLDQHSQVNVGESVEIPLRSRASDQEKLWLTRGDRWVPSLISGPGRTKYVEITNISDRKLILQRDERIGLWLAGDRVPRLPGYVSVGSRRYAEWQNLAFQATSERQSDTGGEAPLRPAVERPSYPTPRAILKRNPVTVIVQDKPTPAGNAQVPISESTMKAEPPQEVPTPEQLVEDGSPKEVPTPEQIVGVEAGMVPTVEPIVKAEPPEEVPIPEQIVEDESPEEVPTPEQIVGAETGMVPIAGPIVNTEPPEEVPIPEQIGEAETGVGGELAAEDFEQELAVIPEIVISLTDEVSIEDIKMGDLTVNTPEEIDQLRRMIWKKKHLLVGKGNALPPAARGVVCDIDV